jgi:phenylalanyl-tRNA synthetase beta chain
MRVDLVREADLIEELARHHGYDRIPATFPPLRATAPRPDPRIGRKTLLRHALTAAGFSEAIGYSFLEEATAAACVPAPEVVALAHPLSETFAVLRPSLLPGLVAAVAHNRRHERADVRLFEIGSCFSASGGEQHHLALVWAGAGSPEHWSGGHRMVDFFDIKGVVERVGEVLHLPLRFTDAAPPCLVPGRAAEVLAGDAVLGVLGQCAPSVARHHEVLGADEIFVAELSLDAIDAAVSGGDRQVEPLPRFPSVVRDISIVIDEGLRSEAVRATIRGAAPETLVQVREFDRYQGRGIPEGRYSLSLRLTFRAPDRTLTVAEVQQAMDRILAALTRAHQAVQR